MDEAVQFRKIRAKRILSVKEVHFTYMKKVKKVTAKPHWFLS